MNKTVPHYPTLVFNETGGLPLHVFSLPAEVCMGATKRELNVGDTVLFSGVNEPHENLNGERVIANVEKVVTDLAATGRRVYINREALAKIATQNLIGATATQEDIERGLASKHEVTRNRWAAIQKIRDENNEDI